METEDQVQNAILAAWMKQVETQAAVAPQGHIQALLNSIPDGSTKIDGKWVRIAATDEIVIELRRRLAECEAGSNEHGPYWVSAGLVAAMRWFYEQTEGL